MNPSAKAKRLVFAICDQSEDASALLAYLAELESIVGALAAEQEEAVAVIGYCRVRGCGYSFDSPIHADSCPYRRAVEAVKP